MSKKTYVGKGRGDAKYDKARISIDLGAIPKEEIKEYNGKKYIFLVVSKMKQPDNYGRDYTVYIDDYKPEKKAEGGDEIPF